MHKMLRIRLWGIIFGVMSSCSVAWGVVYQTKSEHPRGQTVMLFANHPGGANALIPLIKPLQESGYDVDLYGVEVALEQYVKRGFEGTDLKTQVNSFFDKDVRGYLEVIEKVRPAYVVTSADGETREQFLWKAAHINGIPSMAVLDWWPPDYSSRFSLHTPTKICVLGEAERPVVACQLGMDLDDVAATGSPHFDWVRQSAETLRVQREELRAKIMQLGEEFLITFISSPIYPDQEQMRREFGYTEPEMVKALVKNIESVLTDIGGNKKVVFALRPHPRLPLWDEHTLNKLTQPDSPVRCIIDKQPSSLHSIAVSDLVCGIASTVLGEAIMCDAPVLSVQIGLAPHATDPFIFSRKGVTSAITSEQALYNVLRRLIVSQHAPYVQRGDMMCRDAVLRIIAEMQGLERFVDR